ncbi:glycine cleavage system protein H [Planctomycetales bacterium]|nr:glycine cleavage system protein H [Planctomycetales bacterium]GHT36949.1 glycine cleavage system protein H [Planctomycetales bacterium]
MTIKYAKTHEWAKIDSDNTVTVGITDFAVKVLTDLVFIELPQTGTAVTAGESFGEVESVKAVSELVSPVSGEVIGINADVADNLEILSRDPFGAGWLIKVKTEDISVLNSLLDEKAYRKQCAEEEH